jgi:hypothetical protein
VATFLGLAERAGMTLTDVASLARAQRSGDEQARAEATSACGRERNLLPVALKAHRALQDSHRKKPRLPGICRTRAGLNLYCRAYGGRCRTRTDTCRPAPCQPSGSKPVPVRRWPVLDQTGRPTGRQDRLPGRHMLRHCYSGRSQAGTNDLYL